MTPLDRIYLDNAATSWPKPRSVYDAVDRYQREIGVAAGRGSYEQAEEVARLIQRARRNIAKLINAAAMERIIFTFNCTDSLNLAIHGMLGSGDHVITSVAEHNSILRPLSEAERQLDVKVTYLSMDASGHIDPDDVRRSLRPQTRLIALTHASNVTGAVQPVAAVGEIARQHDCYYLVDAAQTLGHVPLDVDACHIDLLAAPGHKGLLGPLGTGILYVAPGVERALRPIRQGGTGTRSESSAQPEELPAKYESGNLNVPGLFGLDAGVRYVLEHQSHQTGHERHVIQYLRDALGEVDGLRFYSAPRAIGIISFNLANFDPREVASMLDSAGSVQVRAGLHCAPEMHRTLGTLDVGGTVRVSAGPFNTAEQMDRVAEMITAIAAAGVS